ncbi:hypothetical protein V8F20_004231 [Naviculisporaceae sp. PSN 640]
MVLAWCKPPVKYFRPMTSSLRLHTNRIDARCRPGEIGLSPCQQRNQAHVFFKICARFAREDSTVNFVVVRRGEGIGALKPVEISAPEFHGLYVHTVLLERRKPVHNTGTYAPPTGHKRILHGLSERIGMAAGSQVTPSVALVDGSASANACVRVFQTLTLAVRCGMIPGNIRDIGSTENTSPGLKTNPSSPDSRMGDRHLSHQHSHNLLAYFVQQLASQAAPPEELLHLPLRDSPGLCMGILGSSATVP